MKLGRYVRPLRTVRGRKRPHVAFVLSGGGVLGAVQVGQLRALIEAGIVPDVLIGTSVGALNAAAVAADPTPAGVDLLADVWLSLHGDDLFPGTRVQSALHFVKEGDHLYAKEGISAPVRKLRIRSCNEMQKPVIIVAPTLHTGAGHVLQAERTA